MQKYNKFWKLVLTYRYFMFKMRELTDFRHKITHFIHFQALKQQVFLRNMQFLDKNDYFCTVVIRPLIL